MQARKLPDMNGLNKMTVDNKTPLLDKIAAIGDLRRVPESDLQRLATELRHETIRAVAKTGGHLGAGLGVVELTVALHYVFNTPDDRLIWDVGHQAYPHKILTGRRDRQMLDMGRIICQNLPPALIALKRC